MAMLTTDHTEPTGTPPAGGSWTWDGIAAAWVPVEPTPAAEPAPE